MRKAVQVLFCIGLLIIPSVVLGEVYKWVDDKGGVHFTDDYSTIPEKYRQIIEKRALQEDSSSNQPIQQQKSLGKIIDMDGSVRTREAWTTEAAASEAGPKPTDHVALIRSWLKTSLHVSTEAQVDIEEVTVSMYIEEEDGSFGTREKVWWGWGSTVTVRGAERQQGAAAAASMTCKVYMKEDRVVFALFPNGSAITADGIRIPPGARIPGLMR